MTFRFTRVVPNMTAIPSPRSEKAAFAKSVGIALCLVALAVCVAVGQPWETSLWRVAVRSIGADDNRGIQGTWHVVSVEDCGRPIPIKQGTQKVIFNGNAVQLMDRGMSVTPTGSFTLDSARKAIDLVNENAQGTLAAESTYPGLYQLSANRLVLCMARPGQARPKDLETSPRNLHTVLVLERQRSGKYRQLKSD
jgi:uncharacterized protein (TIGR03067 family)